MSSTSGRSSTLTSGTKASAKPGMKSSARPASRSAAKPSARPGVRPASTAARPTTVAAKPTTVAAQPVPPPAPKPLEGVVKPAGVTTPKPVGAAGKKAPAKKGADKKKEKKGIKNLFSCCSKKKKKAPAPKAPNKMAVPIPPPPAAAPVQPVVAKPIVPPPVRPLNAQNASRSSSSTAVGRPLASMGKTKGKGHPGLHPPQSKEMLRPKISHSSGRKSRESSESFRGTKEIDSHSRNDRSSRTRKLEDITFKDHSRKDKRKTSKKSKRSRSSVTDRRTTSSSSSSTSSSSGDRVEPSKHSRARSNIVKVKRSRKPHRDVVIQDILIGTTRGILGRKDNFCYRKTISKKVRKEKLDKEKEREKERLEKKQETDKMDISVSNGRANSKKLQLPPLKSPAAVTSPDFSSPSAHLQLRTARVSSIRTPEKERQILEKAREKTEVKLVQCKQEEQRVMSSSMDRISRRFGELSARERERAVWASINLAALTKSACQKLSNVSFLCGEPLIPGIKCMTRDTERCLVRTEVFSEYLIGLDNAIKGKPKKSPSCI